MHEINLEKYNFHTDMLSDCIEEKKLVVKTKSINGVQISKFWNNNKSTNIFGNCITLSFKDITDYTNYNNVKNVLKLSIIEMLNKLNIKKSDDCLIIGLGNNNSTPDSLGTRVSDSIIVTRHISKKTTLDKKYRVVSTIAPLVEAKTGIESFDIIKSIVKTIKPKFLIIIDSLVTNDITKINKCIQISDTGITPASGINNNKKEISYNTFKIPVIALGVPTVLSYRNLMVTVKEIDFQIEKLSLLITSALNDSLHKF